MTARSLVAALAVLLLCAPPAGATLTFSRGSDRNPYKASIYVAKDDGRGARRLAAGEWSAISPDGSRVAVIDYSTRGHRLSLYPVAGGPGLTINAPDCSLPKWSPNSAALACPATNEALQLIDAASGAVRSIATGPITQLSFSPDATRVAYATGPFNQGSDVKLLDLATSMSTTLREDAAYPVWGPAGIALATIRGQGLLDVARLNPDGSGFTQLTHLRASTSRRGIFPVAWSADGTRLLAGIWGLDAWTGREAYGVDAVRGGFHLVAHTLAPAGFSRDGRFVVGPTGDAECCGFKYSNIARAPWTGGRAKVLVRHSMQSSFNG